MLTEESFAQTMGDGSGLGALASQLTGSKEDGKGAGESPSELHTLKLNRCVCVCVSLFVSSEALAVVHCLCVDAPRTVS